MYYHTTKVSNAKLIHKKHPKADLDQIIKLIGYGLERRDMGINTAIYISDDNLVEYCILDFYKENEDKYGKQGYFKIKY